MRCFQILVLRAFVVTIVPHSPSCAQVIHVPLQSERNCLELLAPVAHVVSACWMPSLVGLESKSQESYNFKITGWTTAELTDLI